MQKAMLMLSLEIGFRYEPDSVAAVLLIMPRPEGSLSVIGHLHIANHSRACRHSRNCVRMAGAMRLQQAAAFSDVYLVLYETYC
jgi:hypothetical protein